MYPIYAWTFARAGLLLAPLIADSTEPNYSGVISPSVVAFCPAALQADYMDGLWTKAQRTNQAVGQCCLNDLFATLYWAWCQRSEQNTRCGSSDFLHSTSSATKTCIPPSADDNPHDTHSLTHPTNDRQNSIAFPGSSTTPVFLHRNDGNQTLVSNAPSVQVGGFFGSTKRRIIPPRRRKTVLGVQLPKTSSQSGPHEHKLSNSPLPPAKFYSPIKTQTLSRAGSRQSTFNSSHPELEHEPETTCILPSNTDRSRWRPWAPHCTQSATRFAFVNEQPMLRVMVMDEQANRLCGHLYPLRPNLTANELCNMLAFKMKIYDPKEFGLFAYIDGKEIPLDDNLNMADFTESMTCHWDSNGSQHTLSFRFRNETLCSLKDFNTTAINTAKLYNKFGPHLLSSRSDSLTSSSSESHTHRPGKLRPSRSTLSTWWALCKRNAPSVDRKCSTPSLNTELIGPAPTVVELSGHTERSTAGGTGSRPLLVYRRINGVFAISDRALCPMNNETLIQKHTL
ncbi:hypothetical protein P879_08425 [Paragonimus westermani]|uniref:Ras-associating domain-containing protein n=1 Tax=Paragonimus westermani TaxID=34504 RepID=A0A8T0DBH5_9TREM|nr:hypothetical protein P879_08425 [Paragonimus westermani]